jgi:hypothetical protein
MANLPVNILHNNIFTRDDLKLIINTTYNLYGGNDNHHQQMRHNLLFMAEHNPLIWAIQHFLRECAHQNWNLAIVFAENPQAFMNALEQNDLAGYYANINQ